MREPLGKDSPLVGRFLVVDDNEVNRDLLTRRVERHGHKVVTAANGREALARLREEPFDVVLLDIMMPEMDGYQVLEEIKADPLLRPVRVIMISAVEEIESVTRCLTLGADDYLPKPFDRALLAARIASSLARKRLHDREQVYLRGMERELEIGRQIQAGFLPARLPEVPGWDLAAAFEPARQVGGDFYDAFVRTPSSQPQLAVVVADVCDKGVGAALFMALFRTLIRVATSGDETDAADVLARTLRVTNDYIAENHGEANMFATLFLGILDAATGELTYVNAGHERPLVLAPGAPARRLAPTGPAVGLLPAMAFEQATESLAVGESLVLFTDGVSEARAPDGSLYGEQRLVAALGEAAGSAERTVGIVIDEIARHADGAPPADDVTLLVVHRRPPPADRAAVER